MISSPGRAFFNDVNLPDTVRAVGNDPYADKGRPGGVHRGQRAAGRSRSRWPSWRNRRPTSSPSPPWSPPTSTVTPEAYGEQYKTDMDLWARGLSKIP